jgi:MFS family permease
MSQNKPVKRNITLLYWFNFLTDFRLYGPFAIIYFSEIAGSYVLGMAVFSITQLTSAFFELPTGVLSDRIGRRKTIILGAFFSSAAILCYAIAPGAAILFLGGFMEGIARSLYSGNNAAMLYDTLAEEDDEASYHHYFGRMSSMYQIALGIAALLGGVVGIYSLNLVMWLSLPPQLGALLLSFWFVEPDRTEDRDTSSSQHLQKALGHIRDNPRLLWLTVAQSISFGFGEAKFQFTSAFFISLWPLWAIGLLKSAGNALAAIGFWIAGHVIDRFQNLRVIIFCGVTGQAFNLVGVLLANIFSPIIITAPSILFGLSTTARNHLFQQSFTDEQRATLGSIVSFAGSIVFALAAFLIGTLADNYGAQIAMITAILIQALVIPIYIILFRTG